MSTAKKHSAVRDGLVKRGSNWSYVIRVADPETGITCPRWVGGFPTEDAAKAARDTARVAARRGEYVDRDTVTVGQYLLDWLDTHAGSVKPKTLSNYRYTLQHYVMPNIGGLRLQGLRPSVVFEVVPRVVRERWAQR